ncbi:hypothetical protein ABTK06_19100, partial [Acinetobacter baumannii]
VASLKIGQSVATPKSLLPLSPAVLVENSKFDPLALQAVNALAQQISMGVKPICLSMVPSTA